MRLRAWCDSTTETRETTSTNFCIWINERDVIPTAREAMLWRHHDPFANGAVAGAAVVGAEGRAWISHRRAPVSSCSGLCTDRTPRTSTPHKTNWPSTQQCPSSVSRTRVHRVFKTVEWLRTDGKTEFIGTVQGQCAPGSIQQPVGSAVTFGGEPTGVLAAAAPVVVMNQLGTVYATKRRRRNGKRYDIKHCKRHAGLSIF